MKYICYEEGLEGSYSENEVKTIYKNFINKTEYQNFDGWLFDMLKCGIFTKED